MWYNGSMLTNLLKAFQLNDKEVRVFLRALEFGPQPASSIARSCELPRNTVRGILDALVKKGLMIKTRRANTQYYGTETKENILLTLAHKRESMEKEIARQMDMVEQYGTELSTRHYAQSRPKITFYEGTSGLEKVYEDTLTSKTELRSWGSFDANNDALPEYFKTYYKRRAQRKIPMKSIHPDTPLSRAHQARNKKELRESALVPVKHFDLTPEIQVYDNKVNVVSWKDKMGIIIESQEIADAVHAIFELSYEAAKKHGRWTSLAKTSRG
jgi:sugar-specific transcriptional regulator TrmB